MCSPDPAQARAPAGRGLRSRARGSGRLRAALWALALGALAALPVSLAQAEPVAGPEPKLGRTEVIRALTEERLSRDPTEETTHTLRWKETGSPKDPAQDTSAWVRFFEWLGRAIDWIAEGGRWGIWVLGAIAFALLVVGLRHWLQTRSAPLAPSSGPIPIHVGSLDVRPESLPDDLGAAAQLLWDQGQARAALSLLYRGALSRLIHLHGVAIRGGHTEGECLRLAGARLDGPARVYFASLVGVWERYVYAGQGPDAQQVSALTSQFEARLGPAHASSAGVLA